MPNIHAQSYLSPVALPFVRLESSEGRGGRRRTWGPAWPVDDRLRADRLEGARPRTRVPLRLHRTADACAAFGARWFVRGRRRMRGICTWGDVMRGSALRLARWNVIGWIVN